MSPMAVAGALAATALVFLIAFLGLGAWVSGLFARDRRGWHRPLVATLATISGALFIAAAWVAALAG